MEQFTWDAFLEVGNEHVDDDHKHLFDILNDLTDKERNHDQRHVTSICAKLRKYVGEHFAREEQMMEKIGYPDLSRHRVLHADFQKKILEWCDKVDTNWRPYYGGTIYITMLQYLLHHIMDEDHRCAAWIRTGRLPPVTRRRPLDQVLAELERNNKFKIRF